MKKVLSSDGHACSPVTHAAKGLLGDDAKHIASRVPLPRLRYTLPDHDKTWVGRFHQMLVDHLHKNGD